MRRRILLKISGQILDTNSYNNDLSILLNNIEEISNNSNIDLAIVVGGGNVIRGRDQKKNIQNRLNYDKIGMLSTIINSIHLQTLLREKNIDSTVLSALDAQSLCKQYDAEHAKHCIDNEKKIVICASGIGVPFVSTDMAAIIRALELECEQVLKMTKVDGIYTCDPNLDKGAVKIDEASYSYVLEKNLHVMDIPAVALAKDNLLKIKIFNIKSCSVLDVINSRGIFSIIN